MKTQDFVNELAKVNWHYSLGEANEWIKFYVSTYRDISTHEGEDKIYQCFNPKGVVTHIINDACTDEFELTGD